MSFNERFRSAAGKKSIVILLDHSRIIRSSFFIYSKLQLQNIRHSPSLWRWKSNLFLVCVAAKFTAANFKSLNPFLTFRVRRPHLTPSLISSCPRLKRMHPHHNKHVEVRDHLFPAGWTGCAVSEDTSVLTAKRPDGNGKKLRWWLVTNDSQLMQRSPWVTRIIKAERVSLEREFF